MIRQHHNATAVVLKNKILGTNLGSVKRFLGYNQLKQLTMCCNRSLNSNSKCQDLVLIYSCFILQIIFPCVLLCLSTCLSLFSPVLLFHLFISPCVFKPVFFCNPRSICLFYPASAVFLCSCACSWSPCVLCVPALFSVASGLSSALDFSSAFPLDLPLPAFVQIEEFGLLAHHSSLPIVLLTSCFFVS